MRLIFWISLLAIGLTVLGAGAVAAGSLVEFPNVSEREPKLVGYLARPDAGLSALAGGDKHRATVYPAVVVLHGCGGISSHTIDITDQLGAGGYVALAVDSLGPRGIANACSGFGLRQAFDAYAALRYLAQQEFVDPTRIAVLGQSMGGYSTLYAVDRDLVAQYFAERFRAAVAYFPACGVVPPPTFTAPVLILIGEADDWTPVSHCRDMVRHARPDSAPIAMAVYPGAHHAFDVVQLFGHWIEYNGAAAQDAEVRVRNFLGTHLATAAAQQPTAK